MESFWTGLSGINSLLTGGLLPIYGEPEAWGHEERLAALLGGGQKVVEDVARDPLLPWKRGGEVALKAATGHALPWWVWLSGALGVAYFLKGRR